MEMFELFSLFDMVSLWLLSGFIMIYLGNCFQFLVDGDLNLKLSDEIKYYSISIIGPFVLIIMIWYLFIIYREKRG
jgi:hypothetical protein